MFRAKINDPLFLAQEADTLASRFIGAGSVAKAFSTRQLLDDGINCGILWLTPCC